MNKANKITKKKQIHTEKDGGITYNFCIDKSKECMKRNQFYNQIRKDLLREKYKKYFKNEVKE